MKKIFAVLSVLFVASVCQVASAAPKPGLIRDTNSTIAYRSCTTSCYGSGNNVTCTTYCY